MQEELDPEEAKQRFGALKLLAVGDATGKAAAAAPIKIGSAPAELLQWLAPTDRPIAMVGKARPQDADEDDGVYAPGVISRSRIDHSFGRY